jgi:hypothetical protein
VAPTAHHARSTHHPIAAITISTHHTASKQEQDDNAGNDSDNPPIYIFHFIFLSAIFSVSRISGVIKDFVKAGQRMNEELIRERQWLAHRIEQAIVKGRLVMMSVFVGFAEIFLRILVEGLLATERAEVISLPFVFGCASRCGRVNIHMADGVMYGSCHTLSPFGDQDFHMLRPHR